MLFRVGGGVILLAIPAAGFFWLRAPAVATQPLPEKSRAEVRYLGTVSCASASCHNGNHPKGEKGSEYGTWANQDPHTRAYTILESEQARRILANLPDAKPGPATENKLCLKCHATNEGDLTGTGERFVLAEGITCEACHGPAHNYLTQHHLSENKKKSADEKERLYGLKNLKDLVKRAELCIRCHVGDGSRDVNHELIAAGHPRLTFDLAGYEAVHHKHWTDAGLKKKYTDFPVRLWVIGRVTAAKAAVDLLASRAREASRDESRWPEFAEYACYNCHRDREVNSPRRRVHFGGGRLGAFAYGSWHLAGLDVLAEELASNPGVVTRSLKALTQEMQRLTPDPKRVETRAVEASVHLGNLLAALNASSALPGAQNGKLFAAWVKSGLKQIQPPVRIEGAADAPLIVAADVLDWDEATQLYLGMVALSEATGDGVRDPVRLRAELLAFKNRLKGAFPSGSDSPGLHDPLAQPALKLRSLEEHLESIRKQLN